MAASRKTYEAIAESVRIVRRTYGETYAAGLAISALVDYLAIDLKRDNPNFNPDKFKSACKP